jgi:hypothetical protein
MKYEKTKLRIKRAAFLEAALLEKDYPYTITQDDQKLI